MQTTYTFSKYFFTIPYIMLKCRLFYVVHMLSLGLELELIVMAIIPTMDFKKKKKRDLPKQIA